MGERDRERERRDREKRKERKKRERGGGRDTAREGKKERREKNDLKIKRERRKILKFDNLAELSIKHVSRREFSHTLIWLIYNTFA